MKNYSHTKLSLYERCPLAYKRRYIERRTEQKSPALVIGSACHAAAAAYVAHLVERRLQTDVTWDPMPAARMHMDVEGLALNEEGWATVAEITGRLLESFTLDPESYLEHELRTEVPLGGYTWVAVMDLACASGGVLEITDWKSDWALRSQAEVDRDSQLRRYGWTGHKVYNYDRIRARLFFLRHGVERVVELGPEDFAATEAALLATIATIEADKAFTPTPGAGCAWCSWSEDCAAVSDAPLAIVTPADAERIGGELALLEKQTKDRKDALKGWCTTHGPVTAGGLEWGHHESRSPRVTDIGRFIKLVPSAFDYLNVDGRKLPGLVKKMNGQLDGLIEESVSTRFGSRKVIA